MSQFSFPTVNIQAIGPCVTRRVLMERAGVSASQLAQLQQSLVKDQDYFYMPDPNGGMACNYYRLCVIQRLAQAFPTMQAQQMAQEVTAFMGAQFAAPAALPSSSVQYAQATAEYPYAQVQPQYGQPYREAAQNGYREQYTHAQMHQTPHYGAFDSAMPLANTQMDPRVAEFGSAIAKQVAAQMIPAPQQTAMTQADLLNAARTLQSDAVGYVKQGFEFASAAQSQTADIIRRSRPNVTHTTTHNTDQRAYTMLDYLSGPVNEMGRTQFALLASGIFCLVAVICYSTFSINDSNQRSQYAPTSINRGY